MSEQVTLEDAIRNASLLELLSRPDHQPSIEACHQPIRYVESSHTAFKDRVYFVGPLQKFIPDAIDTSRVDEFLEVGEKFAAELYTWRAVSRGIPQVKSNDDPNRNENYDLTVAVLAPEVDKLLKFMDFCELAVTKFVEILRRCVGPVPESKSKNVASKREFVSESLLLSLAKMLDMFCVLDELKRIKSSIKNDHAAYRRVAQFKRIMNDRESVEKSQMLAMFLATNYEISNKLKHLMYIKSGDYDFTDILCDIANLCATQYENEAYILPSEKFMLVRVIGYTLYIINGGVDPALIYKLDSKRRLNLSRFDRIFKQMEVVTLYGDMQLDPFQNYVEHCAEFDGSVWPLRKSNQSSPQSQRLAMRIGEIRIEFTNLLNDLAKVKNEYVVCNVGENVLQWPDEYCHRIANLAIQIIRSIGNWNCLVMETFSWKLGYPADHRSNPQCPPEDLCEQYERATKYNFSSENKLHLIELISMIKSLQAATHGVRRLFCDGIRRFLYISMQNFSQLVLREPLRTAVKKKRDLPRSLIQAVRLSCSDWLGGCEPANDPALRGKKDDPDRRFEIKIAKRAVYPSVTQSYLLRTSVEYLAYEKSTGKQKTLRKEWEPQILQLLETFQKQSQYWPYLINFDQSLIDCADLSALWFREYFLELTLGKSIQFPTDCSLPWMLAEHIVHTRHPTHLENLLYVLDLYNDSAMFALTKLRKQYLYDEIEAEVNLVFSLLLYRLGEQMFSYFKYLAGCILLDKRFRNECAQKSAYLPYPPVVRYRSLVAQHHVHLLGRYIDLKMLLSQRANVALLRSLDTAISLFEASDMPNIVELDALIELNRYAHKLMSELFSLIEFDDLLMEADDAVNKPMGRIARRILALAADSLVKDYCFNGTTERFVKTAFTLSNSSTVLDEQRLRLLEATPPHHLWGSKALNRAFAEILNRYSNFVGSPHFRLMARYLGYSGISTLFSSFIDHLEYDLGPSSNGSGVPTLLEHMNNVKEVMPKSCRLPRLDFGGQALITRYEALLKDLISCNQLVSVFSYLREFGNTLLVCQHLERAMNFEEVFDLKQAGCFNNILPRPFVPTKDGESRKDHDLAVKSAIRQQELRFRPWHVLGVVKAHCSKPEADLAEQADVLTRERLCCGLSLFDTVLLRLKARLNHPFFRGTLESAGNVLVSDDMSEFHRFWSSLVFVMCVPQPGSQETVESLFGDGLIWSGCTIIGLLQQQHRFRALDFCTRILAANRLNPHAQGSELDEFANKPGNKSSGQMGIKLEKMIERYKQKQKVTELKNIK